MSCFFVNLIILSFFILNLNCQDISNMKSVQKSYSLEIPIGKCSQMEKNVTLKLSTAESKIIDGFMNSVSINCLILENNQIKEISPGAFKFLPNLYFLNLARNSIPFSNLFSQDPQLNLKTLILDENFSNERESNLVIKSYFPNLKYLYLRKIGIVSLSAEIGKNLPNLTHLYLTDNLIEEMKYFPPTLTHLYLEKNLVKKFNATLPKRIEVLSLDGNKMQIICSTYCHEFSLSLNGASKLRHLHMSENELNDIEPDSFDDTVNLLSLDLSKNKLDLIRRGSFNSLSKLQNLSISRNFLKTVPDLSALTNLERLNISHNQIETVPGGEFKNLAMLKKLSISDNKLQNVEMESFDNLFSLEYLDLSNNKLQHLPVNWLNGVENLEILKLSENCFTDFTSLSLGYMESLRVIFLQNNPIRYFNTRLMSNLPKNVSIYLENEYKVECVSVSKLKASKAQNFPFIKKNELGHEEPIIKKLD